VYNCRLPVDIDYLFGWHDPQHTPSELLF